MKYCNKCGSEINSNDKFCGACGNKISQQQSIKKYTTDPFNCFILSIQNGWNLYGKTSKKQFFSFVIYSFTLILFFTISSLVIKSNSATYAWVGNNLTIYGLINNAVLYSAIVILIPPFFYNSVNLFHSTINISKNKLFIRLAYLSFSFTILYCCIFYKITFLMLLRNGLILFIITILSLLYECPKLKKIISVILLSLFSMTIFLNILCFFDIKFLDHLFGFIPCSRLYVLSKIHYLNFMSGYYAEKLDPSKNTIVTNIFESLCYSCSVISYLILHINNIINLKRNLKNEKLSKM